MLNNCVFQGRLSTDPEFKQLDNANLTEFRLAIQRDFKDKKGKSKTDYILCRAWGKNAEIADKYCQKGQMVLLKGAYRNGTPYDDKFGSRQYPIYLDVEKIYFVSSPNPNSKKDNEKMYKNHPELEDLNILQMDDIQF